MSLAMDPCWTGSTDAVAAETRPFSERSRLWDEESREARPITGVNSDLCPPASVPHHPTLPERSSWDERPSPPAACLSAWTR